MSEVRPSTDGDVDAVLPADTCLSVLLHALDWIGQPRHLYEALPDDKKIADFEGLLEILARLQLKARRVKVDPAHLDQDELPALLHKPGGDIWVVTRELRPGVAEVFKGRDARFAAIEYARLTGRLYIVRHDNSEPSPREQGRFGWISGVFERERALVRLLFVVAFSINCLALSLPIYLLSVYDLAIGARSALTLATLAAGIFIILGAEIALREIRARAVARFAIRVRSFVLASVFERLMLLPISYVESASVAGQLNRLRSFELVREIFSGPLATSLLDLPFIIVFVAAVFAIGGALGWILVGFIALLGLMAAFFIPRARARTHRAGVARSDARLFRTDVTQHQAAIRDCAADAIWVSRYRELIAHEIYTGAAAQELSFSEQILAQALSAITGAIIVGLGAVEVINGTLSIGALAAVMAIVWRALAPIQTAMLNLNRLFQAFGTARQINQLMKLPQEGGTVPRKAFGHVRGDITLENVAFRSSAHALPILRGIDLKIRAGELVALTGAPGPSRSILLKLIANLYPPTVGRIRIDGSDMRQFDLRELRRCIALVNDEQMVFSGTLADNLLLANPFASEADIRSVLHETDLDKFFDGLSGGIDADLTALLRSGLSSSISQKIRLARAYLLSPSIYLFDEPTKDMNPSGVIAFLNKLRSLKGAATIVIRTSDPRILELADTVACLEMGQFAHTRRAPHPHAPRTPHPNQRHPIKSKAPA